MSQFASKWNNDRGPGISDKVRDVIRTDSPLKPRLDNAIKQINIQITKLDQTNNRLKDKDSIIFRNVVTAMKSHDMPHATIYANELTELRKMTKMVNQSKLALEQIALRLNTVSELGDVVVTLTPAMGVIKDIQSGVLNVLPEAEHEISEISGLLSGLLIDAGQMDGHTINFDSSNEVARDIMNEASAIAEQKMKDQFPSLPHSLPFDKKLADKKLAESL